jgi:hypothetical protein
LIQFRSTETADILSNLNTQPILPLSASFNIATPPGFELPAKSPPGFGTNKNVYIKPEDYDRRNQALTVKLTDMFGTFNEVEFEKFKKLSIEFRTGKLNANEYLNQCQQLMELPSIFSDLVQEMIVLLPDKVKQSELYKAFENKLLIRNDKKNWSKNQKNQKEITNNLRLCQFCDQYIFNHEIAQHQSKHHSKDLTQISDLNKSIEKKMQIVDKEEDEFPDLITATKKLNTIKMDSASAKKKPPKKIVDDFPALTETISVEPKPALKTYSLADAVQNKQIEEGANSHKSIISSVQKPILEDDFPALSSGLIQSDGPRYSALPSASLFSNPSSHLSLVNKKKHRLQK